MPAPHLFFNEASLSTPVIGVDHFKANVRRFVDAAFGVLAIRPGSRFGFERTTLQSVFFDQTLFNIIASCSPKDQYRRLLAGLRSLDESQISAAHGFRDVRLNGVTSVGATLADICACENSIGWVFSLQGENELYDETEITAERYKLDDEGNLIGPQKCSLPNVASSVHVNYWRDAIHDFGNAIAASARIDEIDGRPIVMYSAPAEHGPPHVHILHGRQSSDTFAKYRFDVFGREKGPPKYDAEMRAWVAHNREHLMRSWDRCQRGLKPFEIDEVVAD